MAGGYSYPMYWAAAHKKVLLFPLILSIGGSSRTGARPAASVIFAIPRLRLFFLLPGLAVKQDLRPLQGAAVFWIFSSGFLVPGGEIWYTNVINMEDSADNERRPAQYTTQHTTQSTTQYTTQKLTEAQNMILSYLREHPEATRADLNSHIEGITVDGIKYNLARLQELGLLKRVGSKRYGYWVVLGE